MTQSRLLFLSTSFVSIVFLLTACGGVPEQAPPVVATTTAEAAVLQADEPAIPTAALATSVATAVPTTEASQTTDVMPPPGPTAGDEVLPTRKPASAYADLEVITLLPPDAIPSIDNPQFLSTTEADAVYSPDELIIGVSFDGDSRAYSVPFLSNHEIVNDTVGGEKIAVTW